MDAVRVLPETPRATFIFRILDRLSSDSERLHPCMEILEALVSKGGDHLRWTTQEEHIKNLLRRGLAADNPATCELAEKARESLLRMGQFEYLEIDEAKPSCDGEKSQ